MLCKDWNKFGDGLILFAKESIPCKVVNMFHFLEESEIISINLNISNKKWLLLGYI